MKSLAYLAECLLAVLGFFAQDATISFKKFGIGIILLASVVSSYFVAKIFFNWWIALFITLGCIAGVCIMSILVELLVRLFQKGRKE